MHNFVSCYLQYNYIYRYTFNQYNRLKGNKISVGYIDTVMVIIPFNFELKYKYITECIDNNRDKHVYVDEDLCRHNF